MLKFNPPKVKDSTKVIKAKAAFDLLFQLSKELRPFQNSEENQRISSKIITVMHKFRNLFEEKYIDANSIPEDQDGLEGNTLLHRAVFNGCADLTKDLLLYGASSVSQNFLLQTPFHFAVSATFVD